MYRKPPRDPKEVASFAELRQHYAEVWRMLDECKRMKVASDSSLRARTKEVRGTRADLKKAKSEVVTLTTREHAKSKEISSAKFSSTAATMRIIGYAIVDVGGGCGKWAPVFEHEATIGVLQVIIGSTLAWAVRPLQ